MLARFSKCVFWIPEKILDLCRKNPQKNKLFSRSEKFVENVEKIFFETKQFLKKNATLPKFPESQF